MYFVRRTSGIKSLDIEIFGDFEVGTVKFLLEVVFFGFKELYFALSLSN